MNNRKKVISIDINIGTYNDYLNEICQIAHRKEKGYACFSNVHMVSEAYNNAEVFKAVNESSFSFPDGMPLVKYLNWLKGIPQKRIAGMDFFPDLLSKAEQNKLKVLFYGGSLDLLKKMEDICKSRYPNLQLVGKISPPFRDISNKERENIFLEINTSNPDLVFVSLGCPKQELWMYNSYREINAFLLGVGGAFSVLAGVQRRAPVWMQKTSLEWLYRLLGEPRRLFKRYLTTNLNFIILVVKDLIKRN